MSTKGSNGAHQHAGQSESKTSLRQHTHKDSSGNEIMKRFSNNLRRMIEDRENLAAKSVTFSAETVETSFGGTQTPGQIKDSSVLIDHSQQVMNRNNSSSAKVLISKPMYVKPAVSKHTKQTGRDQSPRRVSESLIHDKPSTPVKSVTGYGASDDVNMTLRRHTMERLCGRVTTTPECFKPVSLETPKTRQHRCSVDILGDDGHDSSMTVAVRVRPFNKR